jgi:hypothetical protein
MYADESPLHRQLGVWDTMHGQIAGLASIHVKVTQG